MWLAHGGMAEDDGLAPAIIGFEEVFANPEQVLLSLVLQGNARAKTGVNKEVVLRFKKEA